MDSRTPQPESSIAEWLEGAFTRLAVAVALLGGLFLAFRYFGHDQLNEEIRRRAEEKLQAAYPGLQIHVESARRLGDRGLELCNVRIAEGGDRNAPLILELQRVIAACNTTLPDFLTQSPEITGVTIRGFRLRAERKASGVWNASHLLAFESGPSQPPIPVVVEEGQIELLDANCRNRVPLVLRNVQLRVVPTLIAGAGQQATCLRFQGALDGDHFDRATLSGEFAPGTGAWSIAGSVEGLEFTPRLRAALCDDWQQRLASLASIRGRTRFGFEVKGVGAQAPPIYSIAGEIDEGRIDDERLPDPLTDLTARIQADQHGLVVEELIARMGSATLELSGRCQDFTFEKPAEIQLTGRTISLDRLPWDYLPASLKNLRSNFNPQGEVDVAADLRFDGQSWKRQATITARDLSLRYVKFPYLLTGGGGTIRCRGDYCRIDLAAHAGGRTVTCQGDLVLQGRSFVGRVDLATSGPVPIDEQLLTALPESVEGAVRALRPRGSVGVFARFERAIAGEPFASTYELRLQDCSIQHDKFRYPLDRIEGRVRGERGIWKFQEIHGRNDSGYVVCNGEWKSNVQHGAQLALMFTATDLPLEDELREALSPTARRLWDGLRPRGNLDHVRAELHYDAATKRTTVQAHVQKWPASQNVQGRSVTVEPVWVPLRLDQVTGSFHFRDGEIVLEKVKANYGKAAIELEGACRPDGEGGWQVGLGRVVADHFVIDEALLDALPSQAARTLAGMKFSGTLGGQGAVTVRLPAHGKSVANWDVGLDIENVQFHCGRPVTHVCGGARITGQATGDQVESRGDVQLDSLLVNGVQITNLQGPFRLNNRQVVLGESQPMGASPTFAAQIQLGPPTKPVLGRAFAGQIQLSGSISLLEDGHFALQSTLENGDLQTITRELLTHPHDLKGRTYATLKLEGTTRGSHTWRGEGKMRLQEADVSQAPLAVALVKLLTDKAVFTSSQADFHIEGEDVEFSRLDLNGDALCLKGRGRMQLAAPRRVDLQFYSQVGRDEYQLSMLRPLLGAASKQFLLVEVTGTAEQPDVKKTMMPAINEQLRQFFPELAEGMPQTISPPPLLATPRDWFGAARSVGSR